MHSPPASLCRSSEDSSASDNAVSALGKVIEFRRDCVSDAAVGQAWLRALPLFEDVTEAAVAHAQLLRRVEANDPWCVLLLCQFITGPL